MKNKLCLFIIIAFFSSNALAEYYLVYSAPCPGCSITHHTVKKTKHHKHKAKHKYKKTKHYYRKSSYRLDVYYVVQSCCGSSCGSGPCAERGYVCRRYHPCSSDGYAISGNQPRYPGEYCSSYRDIVEGPRD